MVGDEDQSIYSWRGADINNILDFERDFPGARTIRLEQNYRSTKNILSAAGAVVANNKARKGKNLWTEADRGEMLGLYVGFDAENEALFIADTIERLLAQNPDARVAVLYRTNSQSRQIEEALRRYGRKYLVVGGFSFYQRAEIKDARRLPEAGHVEPGFGESAARDQHAGARYRPDHRRADGCVRARKRAQPVGCHRAHDRSSNCFPRARSRHWRPFGT